MSAWTQLANLFAHQSADLSINTGEPRLDFLVVEIPEQPIPAAAEEAPIAAAPAERWKGFMELGKLKDYFRPPA
jgi:hypothetical protein